MIPAYIEFKKDCKCSACGANIKSGSLGFWTSAGYFGWHFECGDKEWKAPGTPYDIRKQTRINHEKKPEPDLSLLSEIIVKDDLEISFNIPEKKSSLHGPIPYTQEELENMTQPLNRLDFSQSMLRLIKLISHSNMHQARDYANELLRLIP